MQLIRNSIPRYYLHVKNQPLCPFADYMTFYVPWSDDIYIVPPKANDDSDSTTEPNSVIVDVLANDDDPG